MTTKRKKAFAFGGVLDGVLTVANLITERQNAAVAARTAKNNQIDMEEKMKRAEDFNNRKTGLANLDDYAQFGFTSVPSYYAYGGQVIPNPIGGDLKKLSSDTVEAQGATHAQGGINIGGNNVVEDNEVIVGDFVFSDRIPYENGTVASKAKSLSKQKGDLEKQLADVGNSRFKKSDITHELEKIDAQLSKLFQFQESFKNVNGLSNTPKEFALGGKKFGGFDIAEDPLTKIGLRDETAGISTVMPNAPYTKAGVALEKLPAIAGAAFEGFKYAAPYLDNIANANLINKMPEIPKPHLAKPVSIPRVSPNARLREVDASTKSVRDFASRNLASANVAAQVASGAEAKGISAKNQILANVDETNATLAFRENWLNSGINQKNVDTLNKYDLMGVQRDWEKNRYTADNWTNAVEDFKLQLAEGEKKKLDALKIRLTMANDATGSGRRAVEQVYREAMASGDTGTVKLMLKMFPDLKDLG